MTKPTDCEFSPLFDPKLHLGVEINPSLLFENLNITVIFAQAKAWVPN